MTWQWASVCDGYLYKPNSQACWKFICRWSDFISILTLY